MSHSTRRIFILLTVISFTLFSGATLLAQSSPWPEVKKEMRPWTRWWWMGNAVNEQGLAASLETYRQAGIGGVEIASIYGVKGNEQHEIEFLSPRWMQMLGFTVKKAGELNMGVDLTNGTGWPFGGPQVTPAASASKLIVQKYDLSDRKPLAEKIRVDDPKQEHASLQFVTAYSDKGGMVPLADHVRPDGSLNWTTPPGNWQVYAAFNGKTRQTVKRFSPGGAGYTLNHFSKDALLQYLSRFDSVFSGHSPGVRAFYNDSYEVYGADWSEEFLNAFQKKRGYDFRQYIREFVAEVPSDLQARLKSDYRETMAEMLLDNFTRPWTAWAHGYGAVTKNQAHGSPGNLLDLYAAVDIPECETFGSSYFPIPGLRRDSADIRNVDPDPVMLRFPSSAAHVSGHNLVSCETFTWLTEHFKTSLSQCKPEVEQVFLAGINHVFFHGTTYYPPDAAWPGWMFYASVNFVPSNSFWPHLPGLTSYISRVQSVLQSGKADNELLLYWPVYDVWHKASGKDMPFKVHDVDEWLHPSAFYRNALALKNAGYSADYISDHLLEKASVGGGGMLTAPGSSPYKVLIIPTARLMPLSTLQKVIQLAQDGATVVFQELPEDVPGLGDLDQRRAAFKALLAGLPFRQSDAGIRAAATGKGQIVLSADIQKALQWKGIRREELTDTGLQFVRRRSADDIFYYLVNHTPRAIDQDIPLNCKAGSVIIMDPQTGEYGTAASSPAGGNSTRVRVQMQPGEALILKATAGTAGTMPAWTYLSTAGNPVEVKGDWMLRFTEGGPDIPRSRKLKRPVDWTSLSDSSAHAFSGSATYSATFTLPKTKARGYILDLGQVHESARVWVNGQDAGILWSFPFRARIGSYLKPGKNEIRIEVANLMANRIRSMDRQGIQWKKFKDINVVDINYKPFDASGWKVMPSGLAGPVTIMPYLD